MKHQRNEQRDGNKTLAGLSLGALGVVYGDIGTSPLYAVRESLSGTPLTSAAILGVVSLIFWSLIFVIVIKYLGFIIRADNHGEGGILALFALARRTNAPAGRAWMLVPSLIGAALLMAEGMITPAISVLSAVEGISSRAPGVKPAVIPIAIGILFGLFFMQRRGTGRMGVLFGPVILIWFFCIAAVSLPWIVKEPGVLAAFNPRYAVGFLACGPKGYFILGSIVLCITGAEALYADLGHFGRKPIQITWYTVVFPSLLLSYLGQGAYLLTREGMPAGNPFYDMVPGAMRLPMVIIATAAAVVASQALITGMFSLVRQAIQLGYVPRLTMLHTSPDIEGRVYLPQVNAILLLGCITFVIWFQNSSALASAYGVAVTGAMTVTSLMFFAAMRTRLGLWKSAALSAVFIAADLAFLGANSSKLASGGWAPVLIAAMLLLVMYTWHRGSESVRRRLRSLVMPMESLFMRMDELDIARVPGTAVFFSNQAGGAPPLLTHYMEHSGAIHDQVILLNIRVEHSPRVPWPEKLQTEPLGRGFINVTARYGFMETPHLGRLLQRMEESGLPVIASQVTIFASHSTVSEQGRPRLTNLWAALFGLLNRNASTAAVHYRMPEKQVVELGVRINL
ncbi:potassium transporter Kup [Fibrobacterota bacterium]